MLRATWPLVGEMQGKAPATICPHCGSREFWPSRKRLPESLLGPVLPYRPFRCRTCLKRYLVAKPWTWAALAALVILIAGAGLLFRFGGLDLGNSPLRDAAPAVMAPTVATEAGPTAPAVPAASAIPLPKPRTAPQDPAKTQDSLLFRVHVHIPPATGAGKAQ